jgi:hypothetical protein
MHLAELYARDLGVAVGKPILHPHFFPLPCARYITVHNDNKVKSKEYNYFTEVITLLKPFLGDIKVIQVGSGSEGKIKGVDYKLPTNNFKQLAFVLQNSMCHFGIDSCPVHICSAFGTPTVSLYGHTYASTCSPVWSTNNIILESDRDGRKPSFSAEEYPRSMDRIMPEDIANGVLSFIKPSEKVREKTLHIGDFYGKECVDYIPSGNKGFSEDVGLNVRMDFVHDETFLEKCLSRSLEVTIRKPFDLKFLSNKNLGMVNYLSDDFDDFFVRALNASGKRFSLFGTDADTLKEQRMKFFDFDIIFFDKKEIVKRKKEATSGEFDENCLKKTSKRVLFEEDEYQSIYDYTGETDDFWFDLDWFRIYKEI